MSIEIARWTLNKLSLLEKADVTVIFIPVISDDWRQLMYLFFYRFVSVNEDALYFILQWDQVFKPVAVSFVIVNGDKEQKQT